MIVHRYRDGSAGYQYEAGDRVIVQNTIHGGWFDYGPTRAGHCTVKRVVPWRAGDDGPGWWHVATLEIHYSNEWGPATCKPWQVEPHAETLASACEVEA